MPDNFDFQLIRSRRSSISIQIMPDGRVLVKAPFLMPMFFIKRFISDKRSWIEKHVKAAKAAPPKKNGIFREGDEFMYLGKSYRLHMGDFKSISVGKTLNYPSFLQFRIKTELKNWYINQAKDIITKRLDYYSRRMGVSYRSVIFSDTISKWGSCTADNRLQFNWRLIMSPILVIDYVIIHELTHTIEKNHQEDFWKIVKYHKPAYKQYIKWLRKYSGLLHSLV